MKTILDLPLQLNLSHFDLTLLPSFTCLHRNHLHIGPTLTIPAALYLWDLPSL